ncbi:hypothetical protein [Cobetia sp. AM6]|jgi:hypothetical protein|uniref:hypothetical protein n=1 Tax=Cobetia sp. AM6 TaxID=2661553 RepID=UPI00129907DB|nr:hypothetical protein [Cobetia sp. AM6]BBO56796.1 hypothetical protein CLAM6_21070 [Cobetia sp. AM6]
MSDISVEQFEENMKRELDKFVRTTNGTASSTSRDTPPRARPEAPRARETTTPLKGLRVTLGVKQKRLALEEPFTVQTDSISRMEARIHAEKAARKAGWKIISHVIDWNDTEREPDVR